VLSFTQTIPKSIIGVLKGTKSVFFRIEDVLKKTEKVFFKTSITGICLFCFLYPAVVSGSEKGNIAVILVKKLHLRAGPGSDFPSLRILRNGNRGTVLKQNNGWIKIHYKGMIGFIRNRETYVQLISEEGIRSNSQNGSELSIDRFRKRAKDIDRRLKASKAEVKSFSRKEIDTINSLNEIDLELNNFRKKASALRTGLATLKVKIQASEKTIKAFTEKIAISEMYTSKRLVALYKLSWLGKTPILASAESVSEIFHRASALEQILAYDEETLKDLLSNKVQFQKLLEKQNAQIGEKRSLETDLTKHAGILSQKKTARSKLLAYVRTKKSLKMASIEALKQAAIALNDKIEYLSTKIVYVEPIEKRAQKLFSSLKGLLNIPVKGKILNKFGPYKNTEFNVMNFRSGVDIKADRGEPIHAVCSGKVLYASWFKGYGNMLIINHGENYYTVYAHIEEFFKTKDDSVKMGEVVATVGDTGSRIGPTLYFEVRHHGKPVNPLIWIEKG